jgi:hypothetical protein
MTDTDCVSADWLIAMPDDTALAGTFKAKPTKTNAAPQTDDMRTIGDSRSEIRGPS